MRARYLISLQTAVASSAAPYGYTLTIWTAGAIISHAHGIPASVDALLFMLGAVAAFALVGGVAFRGLTGPVTPEPRSVTLWSSFHVASIGLAIGSASLITHFLSGRAVWAVGGLSATVVYLLVMALKLTLGEVITARREPRATR